MECPRCGIRLGNMQVHPIEQCMRQQEKNRLNRDEACVWCGGRFGHRDTCPRNKSCDKVDYKKAGLLMWAKAHADKIKTLFGR